MLGQGNMHVNNLRQRHVAFHGKVELLNASWGLKSGYMVEFEIKDILDGRANPFKKFTKRRKNKAGSRFKAHLQNERSATIYSDEMMLAAWGDSSNKGQTAKFWLPQIEGEHCFSTYQYKSLDFDGIKGNLTLVEIDDDEQIVDQYAAGRAEKQPKKKPGAMLSYTAVAMGKREDFNRFLEKSFWKIVKEDEIINIQSEEERNRRIILRVCGINSRSDLNTNETAIRLFHDKIRIPYSEWTNKHG